MCASKKDIMLDVKRSNAHVRQHTKLFLCSFVCRSSISPRLREYSRAFRRPQGVAVQHPVSYMRSRPDVPKVEIWSHCQDIDRSNRLDSGIRPLEFLYTARRNETDVLGSRHKVSSRAVQYCTHQLLLLWLLVSQIRLDSSKSLLTAAVSLLQPA